MAVSGWLLDYVIVNLEVQFSSFFSALYIFSIFACLNYAGNPSQLNYRRLN